MPSFFTTNSMSFEEPDYFEGVDDESPSGVLHTAGGDLSVDERRPAIEERKILLEEKI